MSDDDSPPQINLVRIGEHDVVPLEAILDSLKIMADKIRKQSCLEGIKDQLKGYNWLIGDNPDECQMMKALAVVVNEAIQEKKIEPVDKSSKKVNEELYDLLARDDKSKKTLRTRYLLKKVALSEDSQITSPRVLAEVSLQPNVAHWVVASMIERQFEIKWDTPTGEPDDYSFYDFCDTEKTMKYLKFIPRRAHVKTTLFKECRSKQKMLDDLLQMPKNSLCPEVLVKTVDGWTTWQAPDEENNEGEFRPLPENRVFSEDFSWIDQSILEFIKKNADKQKSDHESLKISLKNPTLYWAVVEDRDFPPIQNTKNLKLKPIGQTQVYVGKANNGIKGRWLEDSDNHCEMMKKCLDNVWAMTTYDPLRLEGIQLGDARLALAKVRGEKTALFVMKTFGDDLEKAEIAKLEAEASLREAEASLREAEAPLQLREAEEQAQSSQPTENALSTGSSQTDDISSKLESLQAEVEERREELRRANDDVQKLQDKEKSELRAEGKVHLKRAEKLHLQGKRVEEPRKNIISFKKGEMRWEPTNMAFGMSSK